MGDNVKKYLVPILLIMMLALFIEIFVFNIRAIQSIFYKEIVCPHDQIGISGFKFVDENLYMIDPDSEEHSVWLLSIDQLLAGEKLKNIYLDIEMPDAEADSDNMSGSCKVQFSEEAADGYAYVRIGDTVVVKGNEQSQYCWLYPDRNSQNLRINIDLSDSYGLYIKNIVINAHRPLFFSAIRFLIIVIIMLMAYALRSDSLLWKSDCTTAKTWKACVVIALGILYIAPAWYLIRSNPLVDQRDTDQAYNYLTEAFADGSLSLHEKPSDELLALPNPYDAVTRQLYDVDYMYDTAYYNGQYYVYYGVVPCLVGFLPFYMITGHQLGASYFVFAWIVLFYIGIYLLLKALVSRFYPGASFAALLILTSLVFWGSQAPILMNDPGQYEIPMICGIALIVWGLFLWVSAIGEDEQKLNKLRLTLGSLLMALAVGCRPALALYSFVCIPLFWKIYIKMDRKTKVSSLLALGIPYIPVALGLMWYNYARFDSITQFGYIYNLTALDYTDLPHTPDQLFLGIYDYLLKLPQLDYNFPFMHYPDDAQIVHFQQNPFGHCGAILWEYSFGGFLPVNLCAWLIPFLFAKGKKNTAQVVGMVIAVLALFFAMLNSVVGGIVPRYASDFFFAFGLAGGIAWLHLNEATSDKAKVRHFNTYLIIALIVSLAFHCNYYFLSNLKIPLIKGNTELYYSIYYAFRFW